MDHTGGFHRLRPATEPRFYPEICSKQKTTLRGCPGDALRTVGAGYGIFSTQPFLAGINFSARESWLHNLFASAAGFLFNAGNLLRMINGVSTREKLFHASFLALVIRVSLLFGLAENGIFMLGRGLVQRSFIWSV